MEVSRQTTSLLEGNIEVRTRAKGVVSASHRSECSDCGRPSAHNVLTSRTYHAGLSGYRQQKIKRLLYLPGIFKHNTMIPVTHCGGSYKHRVQQCADANKTRRAGAQTYPEINAGEFRYGASQLTPTPLQLARRTAYLRLKVIQISKHPNM